MNERYMFQCELISENGDIPADISIDKAERAFYCLNDAALSHEIYLQRRHDSRNH
jgi:hypothetical protein